MSSKLRSPLNGHNKPKWNLYDIKDNPEYLLAESYASEFCDIVGIDCTYYLRDPSVIPDPLYGEFPTKGYLDGKKTKILYGVDEIPTLYGMFGMVATDSLIAHIPQSIWYRDVSKTAMPSPDDVIVIDFYQEDYNGSIEGRTFKVNHSAFDQSIFQLKSLVHALYISPYSFSEESQSARDVSSDLSDILPGISAYGDNSWISAAKYIPTDVDSSVYGS